MGRGEHEGSVTVVGAGDFEMAWRVRRWVCRVVAFVHVSRAVPSRERRKGGQPTLSVLAGPSSIGVEIAPIAIGSAERQPAFVGKVYFFFIGLPWLSGIPYAVTLEVVDPSGS